MIHLGFWGSVFMFIWYFGWRCERKEAKRKLDEIHEATVPSPQPHTGTEQDLEYFKRDALEAEFSKWVRGCLDRGMTREDMAQRRIPRKFRDLFNQWGAGTYEPRRLRICINASRPLLPLEHPADGAARSSGQKRKLR